MIKKITPILTVLILIITVSLNVALPAFAQSQDVFCYSCWGEYDPVTQAYNGGCDRTNLGTVGCLMAYGQCNDFGGDCENGQPVEG